MKNKRECKIIQDLLPSYVEDLLSTETKEYVEKHIQECVECKDILNNMQDTIKENDDRVKQKEVNYLKKFKNKMNVLKTILLIVFVVVLLVLGRRIIIVSDLSNKAQDIKQNNLNNYYAKIEGGFAGEYHVTECYYKDGNYKIRTISYSEEKGREEIVFYKNENEQIMLTETQEGKFLNKNAFIKEVTPIPYYNDNVEVLCMALAYGVEAVNLDDIECYVLKSKTNEQYICKETGLMVKHIDRTNNNVTDYEYKFGTVEEADISIPDLSEYKQIQEQVKGQVEEQINEETYSLEYNAEDYKDLPKFEAIAGYAYDTSSPEKAIGVADYVFIAKINGIIRTEYKFSTKDPYTVYSATVIENIKGEIIKDENIEIIVHGGLNIDKKSYTIFSGIDFLNVGEYYILLPYTASDGRLGISNNTSIVYLGKSIGSSTNTVERYREAAKNPIAPEGKKYIKSQLYDAELISQASS